MIEKPEPRCPRCRISRCVILKPNPHPASEWKYHCNRCGMEWIDEPETKENP